MRSATDWMRSPANLLRRRGDTRTCSRGSRESCWPAGGPAINGLTGFGRPEGRPHGGSARGSQRSSGWSGSSRSNFCRSGCWRCLGPGLLHRGGDRRLHRTWRPGNRRLKNRPASGLRNNLRLAACAQGGPQNPSSRGQGCFARHRLPCAGRWLRWGPWRVSRHGFCFRRNRFRHRNRRFAFAGSALCRPGLRRRLGQLPCFQFAEVCSDFRRQLFFNRAGVRFLLLDADFGQVLQDRLGFYLEFPRQFVNAHRCYPNRNLRVFLPEPPKSSTGQAPPRGKKAVRLPCPQELLPWFLLLQSAQQ